LRQRAGTLLPTAASEPGEIIRRYQPALQLAGDKARGAGWFSRNCLVCHALGGQGQAVGPDLAGVGSRPKEGLLEDILEPSRQVSPDFVAYSLVTKAGETSTGLLAAENATSVTLRRSGQPDETILRSQIQEWRAETKSLMPDGLEQGMSRQDMADLLEFLRQPDARLFSKTP
jgi:putative heme-binding domain-containing protein